MSRSFSLDAFSAMLEWDVDRRGITVHRTAAVLSALAVVLGTPGRASADKLDPAFCRGEMRGFVERLSAWARARSRSFFVIPQNGDELLTVDGEPDGALDAKYVAAIDGQGHEELSWGYHADDQPTPKKVRERMVGYLDHARGAGLAVLVVDYCSGAEHADDALVRAEEHDFAGFVADHRELDNVPAYPPKPRRSAAGDVLRPRDARNFLYVLDLAELGSRDKALAALRAAPHDLLVIDVDHDRTPLTRDEVASLRVRPGGGRRLVIAYLSIGEAERYRPYWKAAWDDERPAWLLGENPDWPGNYRVRYWDRAWQALIFGDDTSELARIVDAGFDGVWLDRVDQFETFERKDK